MAKKQNFVSFLFISSLFLLVTCENANHSEVGSFSADGNLAKTIATILLAHLIHIQNKRFDDLLGAFEIATVGSAHDVSYQDVQDEIPFTYQEGTLKGPKNWGSIDLQWQVCDNGKLQSPIDLVDERVQASPKVKELKRAYKPAPAVFRNRGHDIMVEWTGDAGKIIVNSTDYNVKQCHWHSPSEHTLNGTRYDLELHVVHKNSLGGIAVIGILYKLGRPDPFLAQLSHHINTTEIGEGVDLGIVSPLDIKFGSRKYYRYIGSLTVPPCTEGVIWTILKKVRTVSRRQIRALRDAVHDGFEANARPIQQQSGKQVYFYKPEA